MIQPAQMSGHWKAVVNRTKNIDLFYNMMIYLPDENLSIELNSLWGCYGSHDICVYVKWVSNSEYLLNVFLKFYFFIGLNIQLFRV